MLKLFQFVCIRARSKEKLTMTLKPLYLRPHINITQLPVMAELASYIENKTVGLIFSIVRLNLVTRKAYRSLY